MNIPKLLSGHADKSRRVNGARRNFLVIPLISGAAFATDYLHRLTARLGSLSRHNDAELFDFGDAFPGQDSAHVDASAYSNLAEAIADPKNVNKTIVVSNNQPVQNLTVPNNIGLKVRRGGRLRVGSGALLTINGQFEAGVHQIFEGSGSVKFGSPNQIVPQWWGTSPGKPELEKAFNAMPDSNGHVALPPGTLIDLKGETASFPFKKTFLISGPGGIKDGAILINPGHYSEPSGEINGVSFYYSSKVDGTPTGNDAIQLAWTRKLRIVDCTFYNCDRAIHLMPDPGAKFHSTGMIMVQGCFFNNVNHAFYQEQDPSIPLREFTTDDCHFINNIVNDCFVSHIHASNMDGMIINGNTMFMSNHGKFKSSNIRIAGMHDQILIQNNNLFDAGEAGVWLTDSKGVLIQDNNIVGAGSRVPASAVLIDGEQLTRAQIQNNNLNQFSKHGVELSGAGAIAIQVSGNMIEYLRSPAYYGAVSPSSLPHFAISISRNPGILRYNGNVTNLEYNIVTASGSRDILGRHGGVAYIEVEKFVSSETPIVALFESNGANNITNSGLVFVTVRFTDTSKSNTANYLLMVSQYVGGANVTLISASGLTKGGNSNWPSFNWSIDRDSHALVAAPVGMTRGTFFFFLTGLGDISFGRI